VNIGFTVLGEPFAAWVKNCIEERNQRLINERNLAINLDPEIARAFREATNVSSKF
jgi:hypothetical protein